MLWETLTLGSLLALTFSWWHRIRWQRDYHLLIDQSLSTTTPEECSQVAEGWRALIARTGPGGLAREALRMYLSTALKGAERYQEALDELDRVNLKLLGHDLLCIWLNNRAYALAHLGRTEEAIDAIADAEEMRADDVTSPLFLHSCVPGTRGIVLFLAGQLDPAEAALRQALDMDRDSPRAGDPVLGRAIDRLQAERHHWLSRIAAARGDARAAREELERAAAFPETLFGARAVRELAGGGSGSAP